MKKIPASEINFKYPVLLYRDDLIDIETILKGDLGAKELKVLFSGYQTSSISEIPEETKLTNGIHFEAKNPYLSVDIYPYSSSGSRIWIGEQDLVKLGAASKIKNILEKNSRQKLVFWNKLISSILYGVSLILPFLFLFVFVGHNPVRFKKYGLLVLMIFLVLFSISGYLNFHKPKSIIEFRERNKKINFWRRNKDQIYVGLIVGIPLAIIGFILGILYKK